MADPAETPTVSLAKYVEQLSTEAEEVAGQADDLGDWLYRLWQDLPDLVTVRPGREWAFEKLREQLLAAGEQLQSDAWSLSWGVDHLHETLSPESETDAA